MENKNFKEFEDPREVPQDNAGTAKLRRISDFLKHKTKKNQESQEKAIEHKTAELADQQEKIDQRFVRLLEETRNISTAQDDRMNPLRGAGIYDTYDPQARAELRQEMPAFQQRVKENQEELTQTQKEQEELLSKQLKLATESIKFAQKLITQKLITKSKNNKDA